MIRRLLAAPLLLALAACAAAPPPVPPPPPAPTSRCPDQHPDPAAEVDRWVAAAGDGAAPPARRAEAVEQLVCVASARKASGGRVMLGIMTGGISELVLHGTDLFRDSVVPQAKGEVVLDALVQRFCDASDEVHEATRRALQGQEQDQNELVAAVLTRALTCSAEPRALAAVDALESKALGSVWIGQLHMNWMGYELFVSGLEKGAKSERAPIADHAKASFANLGRGLDGSVAKMATSSYPAVVTVNATDARVPELLPALRRATPAFEARLSDPHPEIRIAAARTLVAIGAATVPSVAERLWEVPVAPPAPAVGNKLQELLVGVDPGHVDSLRALELERELLRLARLGRAAAPELERIRSCLALLSGDAKVAAAVALTLVGEDRGSHAFLRGTYTDSQATFAWGTAYSEEAALAVLYLEPEDAHARRALSLGEGPLLSRMTQRVILGAEEQWFVDLLLLREPATGGAH